MVSIVKSDRIVQKNLRFLLKKYLVQHVLIKKQLRQERISYVFLLCLRMLCAIGYSTI